MIFGRLPAPALALATIAPAARYERELPRDRAHEAIASRRAVLTGLGGLAVGIAATTLAPGLRIGTPKAPAGDAPRGRGASAAESGQPGDSAQLAGPLPRWAQEMLDVSEDELLLRAGDFERASMRHRGEGRLAPCFERLFVTALRSRRPEAGMAAACAVRTFERIERLDVLDRLLPALLRREGWEEALQAARGAYRRNPQHRRTG